MKEEVTFVDVDAFGKTAETIGQYLKKGRPILIEGRLRYETWEDKQTKQKKSKLGVVLETFQFLDSGGGRGGDGSEAPPARPAVASASAPASDAGDADAPHEGDDVPF
jgi:single-strand DNA-binding protein